MLFWILLAFTIVGTFYVTFAMVWGDELMAETLIGKILCTPMVFIMGGFMIAFIAALVYVPLAFWADKYAEQNRTDTSQLQAIKMGEGIGGRFFLGSGVINEENVYTYYYKNENGNFQSGRIDADSAEIVEDNDETPRIETHHYKMPWWFGPMDMEEEYTIYVPEGSIKPLVDMELPQ